MHGYHLIDVITLKGSLITVDIICIFLIYSLNIPVQYFGMKDIIIGKAGGLEAGSRMDSAEEADL